MLGLAEKIGNYDNPASLGSRMCRRRSAPLRQMIETVFARQGKVSILDVGGMENYWSLFPPEFYRDNNVTITLTRLSAFSTRLKA